MTLSHRESPSAMQERSSASNAVMAAHCVSKDISSARRIAFLITGVACALQLISSYSSVGSLEETTPEQGRSEQGAPVIDLGRRRADYSNIIRERIFPHQGDAAASSARISTSKGASRKSRRKIDRILGIFYSAPRRKLADESDRSVDSPSRTGGTALLSQSRSVSGESYKASDTTEQAGFSQDSRSPRDMEPAEEQTRVSGQPRIISEDPVVTEDSSKTSENDDVGDDTESWSASGALVEEAEEVSESSKEEAGTSLQEQQDAEENTELPGDEYPVLFLDFFLLREDV